MANTHNAFNPCFYSRIKPRYISRASGGFYHSMNEAPFGQFLSQHGKRGIDWETDTIEYAFDPSVPVHQSRYTPDFNMFHGFVSVDTSDGVQKAIVADLIDIKAKSLENDRSQQDLAESVPTGILGNTHFFKGKAIYPRAFIIITGSEITYFDKSTGSAGVPARIYRCPECGKVEILPAHRLTCTKCAHTFDINDELCSPAEAMVQYVQCDVTRTPLTEKYRSAFSKRCGEYNIDATSMSDRDAAANKKLFRIELPEFSSQYYEADFAFVSQDASMKSYNNTPSLQTHVGIFADPERDAELIEALTKHTADKETPIEAFVFLTPDGMTIAERTRGEVRRKAHFATCPKCGKGYIASDDYPECPHCH